MCPGRDAGGAAPGRVLQSSSSVVSCRDQTMLGKAACRHVLCTQAVLIIHHFIFSGIASCSLQPCTNIFYSCGGSFPLCPVQSSMFHTFSPTQTAIHLKSGKDLVSRRLGGQGAYPPRSGGSPWRYSRLRVVNDSLRDKQHQLSSLTLSQLHKHDTGLRGASQLPTLQRHELHLKRSGVVAVHAPVRRSSISIVPCTASVPPPRAGRPYAAQRHGEHVSRVAFALFIQLCVSAEDVITRLCRTVSAPQLPSTERVCC